MAETKNKTDKIEREYIIPLRHRWSIVPRYKRTNKAIRAIKEFLVRHMKIRDRDLDKIKIDSYLNETVWSRGIRSPPSKIRVKAIKEGDIIRVEAVELPTNIKFKKLRKEKVESTAKDIAKKRKAEKTAAEEEVKEQIKTEEEKEEKKNETGEKKEAVVEAGKEMEKAEAKAEKHTTKAKSPQQAKNQRKGYNQSSRGH